MAAERIDEPYLDPNPRRRPKPRGEPPHSRYRDTLPNEGWQPKSDFFKSIYSKAEFELNNPRIKLICPCCGKDVVMRITFLAAAISP